MRRSPPSRVGVVLSRAGLALGLALAPSGAGLASDAPSAPPAPAPAARAFGAAADGVEVPSAHVEEALVAAGANRAELERALARAAATGDPRTATAMAFLVANLPGKGYVVTQFRAKDGTVVAYDPLGYPTFREAEAAFDALERAHGAIETERARFVADAETLTADFLVRHVAAALEVWRLPPPAAQVSFRAFLEHVLPYRGSEEPVEDWLTPLRARYRDVPPAVAAAGTPRAVLDWVGGDAGRRVRFDERYYLHPTDQGFAEMERSGLGRCEDITNMTTYCARARGVAVAADYTPAWGHRDNNHAWPVLLDAEGRGSDAGNGHAPKVYRKVFSLQRDGLASRLPAGREAPNRWLASRSQVDVTDQYRPTSDVEVALDAAAVGAERVAYLAVFNGGHFVPVAWADVADGRAVFRKVGRGDEGMLWLPVVHDGATLRPVAPPFVLRRDGRVERLAGTGAEVEGVAAATSPEQVSVDTKAVTPVSHLRAGATYVLSRFGPTGWVETATFVGTAGPAPVRAPADALLWLVEKDGKGLERPFVLEGGRQRFW